MPVIPKVEQRLGPGLSRRIISTPVAAPNTAVGDALQQAGEVGLAIAGRIQDTRNDLETAKADAAARARLDKLRFEIETVETDLEDNQIPIRFKQESDAILSDAAKTIGSTRARDAWLQKVGKPLQGDGIKWADNFAYRRGVDRVRGEIVTSSLGLKDKAGDASISRDTFASSVLGQRQAIQNAKERGFLDPETSARLLAELEGVDADDRLLRGRASVEALVRAGESAKAKEVIAAFSGRKDKEQLKAVLDATEQDIRVEKNLAEAETRKGQELVKSQMYLDIWDGKAGRAQIEEAVRKGRVSLNDAPELMSSLRSYQNSMETQAGMTAAQKAQWADWSQTTAMILTSMDAQRFMTGPQGWSQAERDAYQRLDPDRRRTVDEELMKRAQRGSTVDAGSAAFNDAMTLAKRYAPKDWKLGSDNPDDEGAIVRGQIARLTQEHAKRTGGQPMTMEDAKKIVTRAFAASKQTAELPLSLQIESMLMKSGIDNTEARIAAEEFQRMKGRLPTGAELQAIMGAQ